MLNVPDPLKYARIFRDFQNGASIPQIAKEHLKATKSSEEIVLQIIQIMRSQDLDEMIAYEVNVLNILPFDVALAHGKSISYVENCAKIHYLQVTEEKEESVHSENEEPVPFLVRVKALYALNLKQKDIFKTLQEEGYHCSQSTLSRFMTKNGMRRRKYALHTPKLKQTEDFSEEQVVKMKHTVTEIYRGKKCQIFKIGEEQKYDVCIRDLNFSEMTSFFDTLKDEYEEYIL